MFSDCTLGTQRSLVQILFPRLEFKTASYVHSWLAVSRLVDASYANHEAQLSQFKQATQFGMRRRPIARTYCLTGFYGVQILSPLSMSVTLVRVLVGAFSELGLAIDNPVNALRREFTRSALCRLLLSRVTRPGLALTATEACSKAHIPAKQPAAVVFPFMMP